MFNDLGKKEKQKNKRNSLSVECLMSINSKHPGKGKPREKLSYELRLLELNSNNNFWSHLAQKINFLLHASMLL